jgi:hypothetical protein
VEIIFLRGAEADLFAAWVRYEEALPGLGDRFYFLVVKEG